MKQRYKKKPSDAKKVAKERIVYLFEQAQSRFKSDKGLANRYVTLARKIAMKYKVRIPSECRRQFCKHCYKYLMPGANVRVRTTKDNVVYHCLECKKFSKFGKVKERKAKRKA